MNIPFRRDKFQLWLVLCTISAAPSFSYIYFDKLIDDNIPAMLLGIVVFVFAYTVITSGNYYNRLKAKPRLFKSLKWAFGFRVVLSIASLAAFATLGIESISLVSPLDHIVTYILLMDGYPGLLSLALVQDSMGLKLTFTGTLVATLVQGIFLNVILLAITGLIWCIFRLLDSRHTP